MAEKNVPVVCFDPGHGGSDPGAIFNGRKEKDDNLKLALAVGKELAANYVVNVKYTRTTDIFEKPSKKGKDAIAFMADLFVSFHRNSYNTKAKGFEALVPTLSGITYNLGKKLCADMKGIGYANRGVKKRTDLTVLNTTNKKGIPAILLETGFIDNKADNKIFDEKFDKIVSVITKRIAEAVKLKKKTKPVAISKQENTATEFKNGSYNKRVKTTTGLNVRAGRGSRYKILGTLPKGKEVEILYILNGWGSIDYGKNVGYISLEYVVPV